MARLSRRTLMLGSMALAAAGRAGARDKPIELDWIDLVPEESRGTDFMELSALLGIVEHGQLSTGFDQERDASVTTEYNGKTIRIPGYTVPLVFEGTAVSKLLLVPYVGACIHVPPPPPNQIVLATAAEPYEMTGYFEPVYATGTIEATVVATELADIGYRLTDARFEPYFE